MQEIYDISVEDSNGETVKLERYRGQVLLIVNTASRCGFTPQYEGLEKLYQRFGAKGFSVLAFPCNQFAAQEPGDNEEIQAFCKLKYDVTFPVFAKIKVNGRHAHPLYRFLKAQQTGISNIGMIKWNFTKFLVDGEGRVVNRFAPTVKPEEIASDIDNLLCPATRDE